MTGLPKIAPALVTTIALECDGEPRQDHEKKRAEKPREGNIEIADCHCQLFTFPMPIASSDRIESVFL